MGILKETKEVAGKWRDLPRRVGYYSGRVIMAVVASAPAAVGIAALTNAFTRATKGYEALPIWIDDWQTATDSLMENPNGSVQVVGHAADVGVKLTGLANSGAQFGEFILGTAWGDGGETGADVALGLASLPTAVFVAKQPPIRPPRSAS